MERMQLANPPKRLPKWAGTCFRDDAGEIFAPAAIAGSEMEVLLCASYDGTKIIEDHGHIYAPLSWLRREWPKYERIWANVEAGAKAAT